VSAHTRKVLFLLLFRLEKKKKICEERSRNSIREKIAFSFSLDRYRYRTGIVRRNGATMLFRGAEKENSRPHTTSSTV
jgi:hypothetical protein